MDTNTAIVLVVALLALVAVAFFIVFRRRGKAGFKGPFGIEGSLDGGNDPPPPAGQIKGKDLKAGGNLSAVNKAGGNVNVEGAQSKGDLSLAVQSPGKTTDPKA